MNITTLPALKKCLITVFAAGMLFIPATVLKAQDAASYVNPFIGASTSADV